MKIDVNNIAKNFNTPLTAPSYPVPTYKFVNREYLNIIYRTDEKALRAAVPEPLEINEPLVKFEVMWMPDVSGLGAYTEAGQVIPVSFNGEEGDYVHSMYVDNFPAIASGRELSAYPKKLGNPNLYVDSDTLVGTLDYGSLRVATATMGYKHVEMDKEQAKSEICRPNFMVKIVTDYSGKLRVCDLVRTQITDIEIKGAWTGPARLQLFEHALAPLADLPVLEVVSASHILTDLTLNNVRPVYNYLEEK
ncbi:acetoacetate decarboxylase [Bacillus atrophaeus]|uniref:acetoacetate decarboxylase n=1 Tax=Bacillus atrophaeus TaxID=1452 RepID=UPI00077AB226|nr:acetoacetate decarboxylase [Bacillus atrophaeus]KXZ15828.1 acetoacetate decarboxylase [Bacillus atrophaeus]MED4806775.1 acetoacetate decarboxylase [Bacillus atrophaeus]GED01349.1 acetoacetate decarboxylase [Bacillus atrophaeus]